MAIIMSKSDGDSIMFAVSKLAVNVIATMYAIFDYSRRDIGDKSSSAHGTSDKLYLIEYFLVDEI